MGSLFVLAKPWQIFACVFFFIFASQTYASPDTGIAWLKAQQQADGSFRSDFSLADSSQATAEVLIALHQHKALEALAKTEALAFLSEQSVSNLETSANRLRINKVLSANLPVESFKDYSGYSGGFGDYPGYDDSIYATAQLLASIDNLVALQEVNGSAALGFLLSKQRSDKAWSEEGNNSSVVVTAQVNRALQQHRLTFNLNDKISTSSQYLIKAQASSGGWSNVLETAQALLAIIPAASTPSIYEASVQHLINSQLPNGSWNNDPYTTAIALQVLYLLKNPPSIENQELGSIAGTIKSETTGLPVAAVRIDIAGPDVRQISSNADGYFSALSMPAGEYVLTLTAAGYQHATLLTTLAASAPFDIGVINLKAAVNAGLIHGQVTDASTGNPLANVDLVFIGPKKYFAVTDANGFYSQEVDAGQYGVGFALSGYQPITKNIGVGKSAQTEFSPQLRQLNEPQLQEGFLYGSVYDPTAFFGDMSLSPGKGIAGAIVQETIGGASVQTDMDGNFKIPVTPGVIKVVIQKQGFEIKVLDGVYVGEDDVNAGVIKLRPTTSKLYGKIIDAKTGESIPQATIIIEGKTTIADLNGVYQLDGLSGNNLPITVSALGYESASYTVNVPTNDIGRVDFPIKKIKLSEIEIKDLVFSEEKYGAYENVAINGKVENIGEEEDSILIQAQIFNATDELVDHFTLSDSLSSSLPYSLESGEQKPISINWNTSYNPPGVYRLVLSSFSEATMRLLNEHQANFYIVPTEELASIKITANVSEVSQGASKALKFTAFLKNKSNVPVDFTLDMAFIDPQGNEIFLTESTIMVNADSIFSSHELDDLNYLFEKDGAYLIRVNNVRGVQVDYLESSTINALPNIRVDLGQELIHGAVLPDTDSRVKVKIRMEGKKAE